MEKTLWNVVWPPGLAIMEGVKDLGNHILCAGGLLGDEGQVKGSVLIVDFEDRAELDE